MRADRIRERLREVEHLPELEALARAMRARVRELEIEAWLSAGGPLQTGARSAAHRRPSGSDRRGSGDE